MTASRLFDREPASRQDAINAFATGKFSPEVIAYLKEHNIASLVKKLPQSSNQITLSPEFLALDHGKQCSVFNALPEHIKVVNFQFKDLKADKFNDFIGLMAHTGYSKDTTVFNLQWDFHRYPLKTLQDKMLSRAIPRQLEHFNFTHGPAIERVCDVELAKFKETKLDQNTEVHLDRRYNLRHRA